MFSRKIDVEFCTAVNLSKMKKWFIVSKVTQEEEVQE